MRTYNLSTRALEETPQMINRFRYAIIAFCLCTTSSFSLSGDMGRRLYNDDAAECAAQTHYFYATEAWNVGDWAEAGKQFKILAMQYPGTSYGLDANFFLGVSYYELKEYEFANEAFTEYLKCQSNPKYFFEAIEYKFAIAEQFRCGAKRRCFGVKGLPKWVSGLDEAVKIYDEVSVAMPNHEIAAQALFSKACLLWKERNYRESVDTFRLVIRRFPKHELAPESYLQINQVYIEQCKSEFQNPDLIEFAQINLRKFQIHFPNDERLAQAEADVLAIKELYARGLYKTGDFYQRTRRPEAAIIYYRKAMLEFPETITADWCKRRLLKLCPEVLFNSNQKNDTSKEADIEDLDFSDEKDQSEEIDFES